MNSSVSAPHNVAPLFIANGESATDVPFGTNTPVRPVSSAATRSVLPIGGVQEKHLGCSVGEILQARNLVVCDGGWKAGGGCSVDFSTEARLDVSVLRLG